MAILFAFVTLTIFTLMLTIGVNNSLEQLTGLLNDRFALIRGLIAVLVIVPAVAFVLLAVFGLPIPVATGIALLAAAPGAPLTTQRSRMAGADTTYVSGIQLIVALTAIIVTPILLAIFYGVFTLAGDRVSPVAVAWQIAQVTFLPVVIGLAARRFVPGFVARVVKPLNMLANVLFLIMVVALVALLVFAPDFRGQLLIGWSAVIVIVIMAIAAIAAGHLLAGQGKERRAGLAVASLARNVGLAVYIAGLSGIQPEIVPTLLAYILLGTAIQVAYAMWLKRQP
jgi:BASS family bile acid:Na+ symporter